MGIFEFVQSRHSSLTRLDRPPVGVLDPSHLGYNEPFRMCCQGQSMLLQTRHGVLDGSQIQILSPFRNLSAGSLVAVELNRDLGNN